ncbi:FeS assembly protein [Spiroplasma sabaudiense Ar-1343]|uniref:FeS assembly protein n=1 Tax=Spiroplasma sabaudiense Ar-1343 TaxID=1276257 RepID=W6AAE5_9MOLU|nr:iron-sulfur cluster assembly scaffold protein [Spiroplasma sabaudiense]AHI54032.1 FeS assembly protein [Spiroplasma sabaudiense Ar-1343]
MYDKNDKIMMRQIIMQHFLEPDHKGLVNDLAAIQELQSSSTCSDEITLEVLFDKNIISFVKWSGTSCAISSASTDILAEQLHNQTLDKGLEILTNYYNLISNQSYSEESLEELIAFVNVGKQGNRVACALLGANGLKNLISKQKELNHETFKTN